MRKKWYLGLSSMLLVSVGVASESLLLETHAEFLQEAFESPVHDEKSIKKYVQGALVRGTAKTEGRASVQPVPAAGGAVLNLRVESETDTYAVASKKFLRTRDVITNGTTWTTANKPIIFTPKEIYSDNASAVARSVLGFTYRGPRLGMRKALEIAEQSRWSTLREMDSEAVKETTSQMNTQAKPLIAKINESYHKYFYRPIIEEGAIPAKLKLSSTAQTLSMGFVPNTPLTEAMVKARPPMPGTRTMSLRVHETLPVQITESDLAGKRLNEEDLEEFLMKNGIPARLGRYRKGDTQVRLEFPKEKPFEVSFAKNQLTLSFRASGLLYGEERGAATVISARYDLSVAGGEFKAEREREVSMRSRGLAERSATEVARRFSRLFPEEFRTGKFMLPTKANADGELRVRTVAAQDGWLVMTWEHR